MAKGTNEKIDILTNWEWTTLVASWRYYEHRSSITAETFPADIVSRFWGSGRYSREVLDKIAHQFAVVDHGMNGEREWEKPNHVGREPWTQFYAFCRAWSDHEGGFVAVSEIKKRTAKNAFLLPPFISQIGLLNQDRIVCFRCETAKRLYPVSVYINNPHLEIYVDESKIKMIGPCYYDENEER